MKTKPYTSESNPRSVGIWIRVSTEDQAKGESPQHHEERARGYANAKGWIVKELYDLAGVSGKSVMEHPEAKRMLADIRRGHITGLIFSKLARLARNTRELLDFADRFREADADLISLQESIDTSTPAGRLFFTMIAAMAQWEREEIVDRVKASIRVRASLGKTLGGAAPFGYQWKDKKLVVNPQEAPARRLMYELYAEHKRNKTVARLLNEAGYRTRGGARFTDTTVVRLIQDSTAKGSYRANYTFRDAKGKLRLKPESEWSITSVEPIISVDLWNQCNQLMERRKNGRQPLGPKPVQLFGGLLTCACGQKMYVYSRSPKYICPKCRTKIPLEIVEELFREELHNFFLTEKEVRKHLERGNTNLTEREARLSAHERQMEKLQAEMQKAYRLYQDDRLSSEGFGKLYRPLEEQEKQLAAELPRLQAEVDALRVNQMSADQVVTEASDLHRFWPKLTFEEKRSVIESITQKIVVSRDSVDITFCGMPSCEELTKRQRNLSGSSPPPA